MLRSPVSEDVLQRLSRANAEYNSAEPFPHIVVENFFCPDAYRALLRSFPSADEKIWDRYDYKYQVKLACNALEKMPEPVAVALNYLNSAHFLRVLESLTGDQGLVSDPYLVGGGMHQIESGGWLAVHADFTEPSHLKLYRRLNLLIYLNEEWDVSFGGELELWDSKMKSCIRKIPPLGNRCVIFTTTPTSFHGHPNPLNCPPSVTRRSLAVYYYTLEKTQQTAGILTRWQQTKGAAAQPLLKQIRRGTARFFWWLSYRFGGIAGRLDV